jgi:uncharacterized protein
MAIQASGSDFGPLDLLVIQPTPFCNLDCSYCYLPDRQSKKQISPSVLEQVFQQVFASGLVEDTFTIVWHAGEPLVLPPRFYEEALELLARCTPTGVRVQHSFQTNGTLIDEAWCDFVKSHDVRIGVSVDGPAFLHDQYRRTRRGEGTHARVLRGIDLLNKHHVPFHVITVLTRASLDYPDELYDFYRQHNIHHIGFNVEEIEGPNQHSSLEGDTRAAFTRFLARFYDLATTPAWPMRVREFDGALAAIAGSGAGGPLRTHETTPLAILSVDCDGQFSTFSPELLGLKSVPYGDFSLGRVQTDSFRSVLETAKFKAIHAAIRAGVRRCELTCPYFDFCGGGTPVNKYFENGSFDSTETLFCRLSKQAVLDVVLDKLEQPAVHRRSAGLPPSLPPKAEHAAGSRLSLL